MKNNSHNKNFALSLAFIRRFEASIPTYQEKLVQCQRFQMKKGGGGGGGERGCHGRKLMRRRSLTDWLFPEDFQLKILTTYDYLGQWMHWLILASKLDQELCAIWNLASISIKNALGLC